MSLSDGNVALKDGGLCRGRELGDGGYGCVEDFGKGFVGVSGGMDASLWLIEQIAGKESRERVMKIVQYAWRQGVVL